MTTIKTKYFSFLAALLLVIQMLFAQIPARCSNSATELLEKSIYQSEPTALKTVVKLTPFSPGIYFPTHKQNRPTNSYLNHGKNKNHKAV